MSELIKPEEPVLVMRTCNADLTSRGGFQWPESGLVEAPDWQPTAECGNGLHGLLWGAGDGALLNWEGDAKWLICEATEYVDLGGKVKFPSANVVHVGDQKSATEFILQGRDLAGVVGAYISAGYAGTATAGYAGTATAGDDGTATAGNRGTATAGDAGAATAGYAGTATAGYAGTATAGNRGTATAGDAGAATAGDDGTATAGNRGTATAGYAGTATAGYAGAATAGNRGTATAGYAGTLILTWWDGKRYRRSIGYVGEDGIEPNTAYRLNDKGQFVRAA